MRTLALISEHASPLAVAGSVDSGGQNVYVANVARELSALGWQVDVFTRRDATDLPEVMHWLPGIRIIHVPAGPASFIEKETMLVHMDEFARQTLAFMLRQDFEYDLVHANFFMSGLVARHIKQQLGTPYVVTFHALGKVRQLHQGASDRFPPERLRIEAEVAEDADFVIAECPQDKRDLVTHYAVDPARVRIVPCGFDPDELYPLEKEPRRALGWDEGQFVILHVGRMVPRKGVETLIEAMAELRLHHGINDARLVIVGGNSPRPDPVATPHIGTLQQRAERLNLLDRIEFFGQAPRQQLRSIYSAANVFVTTPWYEPFGITPLEAMACGTPVIGSAVGGIKQTVVHGETGFLVPSRSPGALAERLAQLYDHPLLARQMGRAGLKRVHAHYTWARVADLLDQVYTDTLPDHPVYVPSYAVAG